jgi:ATP-dependent RNA helicase DeaD
MMEDMKLAAPLASALAAKGYESLTAVQSAVLADGLEGRDLLVSAQTGSGKTVAFGLAIAAEVLGGQNRLLYSDKPLALVVAPTRELALQVKSELEWLYGPAGAQIASCVGGMDYRAERRSLERGAHIVVGTPGRLRDHIERSSLDLSGLRAAILDEADEMLDMGFTEDLEFILGASPSDRRTLMFSATVPKEIEALARTYQKDAVRIVAGGESKSHADIEYRAYSVLPRDKENAIFNILRYYEAPTAIVFCKTRLNVSHLFARMTNRGFQAVALSGELSQTERTHALQALRDGRARVCIATDVAARGIDLPGLELVIHADLPSNPDIMLHRSGRTGRAGRKGISALVVPQAEFRKASRILDAAKVVVSWNKPPSAEDVQGREDERLIEHPTLGQAPGDEAEVADALLHRYGPEQVAAAFIRLWREGRSAPEVLSDAVLTPTASQPPRERGEFGASVWFKVNVGHEGRAEARWLLPKICEAGSIAKDGIGAIRVKQVETYIQIAEALAVRFGQELALDNDLIMTRMDHAPELDARPPARAPRDSAKPAYASTKPTRMVEDGEAAVAAPRKTYAPKSAEDRKPYTPRPAPAARDEGDAPKTYAPKPYAAKPYAAREEGDVPRKPYARRDDSGAAPKPYAAKPYAAKPYAKGEDGDAPRKPYAPRAAAGAAEETRKPWQKRDSDAPSKPYAAKSYAPKPAYGADGPRKPYVKRDADGGAPRPAPRREDGDAPRKPRWTDGDKAAPHSAGFKSFGTKEGRATGFKSHGDRPDAAPRARREDGDDR